MNFAAEHMFKTGYAVIDQLMLVVYTIFLTPGEIITRAFTATSWGQRMVSEHDLFPITFILAMFFWLIAFSLLSAMDDRVRSVLHRHRDRAVVGSSYPMKPKKILD